MLIIDASKGFEKEGKNNKLRACDIRKIIDTVTMRLDIPKYSRSITREEIRVNDYNLNIPRYVDSSEAAESWDIYAAMFGGIPKTELAELNAYWNLFPSLKKELFVAEGGYAQLRTEHLKQAIRGNADVKAFLQHYQDVFSDLGEKLDQALIERAEQLSIPKSEDEVAGMILNRFAQIALVDKYEAYQIFKTEYEQIAGDLELIQTEGMNAVRQVDPNMVVKKKGDNEKEVQEGWKGHIIPFEFAQKIFLKADMDEVDAKKARLQEIPSEYENLLEECSEEEKEIISEALNDSNDAFVIKNVKAMIKVLKQDAEENKTLIERLSKVENLNSEEKKLKSEIKSAEEELHLKTKTVIENMTDKDIHHVLIVKWVDPICDGISKLPENLLGVLEKKVKALSEKYADTYEDIENEITKTQNELIKMLDELTGSDTDMAGIMEFKKLLGGE